MQAQSTTQFGSPPPQEDLRNDIINGNFDFWQRGTTVTIANGVSTYQADRFYVKNLLGTNGVITFSRISSPSVDGSVAAASVKITTAPTAAQVNGCELYQTLENYASLKYYNKPASLGVQIKALGNVTSVGLQFFYKTSEGKVDTAIGSEVTVTVNTSTAVRGTINGQAMGTSLGGSGVVGCRIRILGVSSGNTYDLNNGFVVEQVIMTQSQTAQPFVRCGGSIAQELNACQRFYEKSYDALTVPGTVTNNGCIGVQNVNSANMRVYIRFATPKRTASSTVTVYSPNNGATGVFYDATASTQRGVSEIDKGETCVTYNLTATNAYVANGGDILVGHFTCDAEI